jgi:VPDSG-CTERM motif
MNIITKTITPLVTLSFLTCGLLSEQAQAAKIQGTIGFSGSATLNNADLGLATQVSNWGPVFVALATLDFASAVGDPVTMTAPWVFNPSGPLANLWSVDGFTFDLTSSVINTQNSGFLDITGFGIVKKTGFDDTDGTWRFSIPNFGSGPAPDAQFVFSAAARTVPDGGTSVALLGLALAGVQFLRRKFTDGTVA